MSDVWEPGEFDAQVQDFLRRMGEARADISRLQHHGITLVGESGPEIVRLPPGSTVHVSGSGED